MSNEINNETACGMSDEQFQAAIDSMIFTGELLAEHVAECGGSFGSAREAAISGFMKGYDEAAARIMAEGADQ